MFSFPTMSILWTFSVRGLFDGDPKQLPYGEIGVNQVCSDAHQELALDSTDMVLCSWKMTMQFRTFQCMVDVTLSCQEISSSYSWRRWACMFMKEVVDGEQGGALGKSYDVDIYLCKCFWDVWRKPWCSWHYSCSWRFLQVCNLFSLSYCLPLHMQFPYFPLSLENYLLSPTYMCIFVAKVHWMQSIWKKDWILQWST